MFVVIPASVGANAPFADNRQRTTELDVEAFHRRLELFDDKVRHVDPEKSPLKAADGRSDRRGGSAESLVVLIHRQVKVGKQIPIFAACFQVGRDLRKRAVVTTVESAIFDMLKVAGTDTFKAMLKIIKED